MNACVSPAPVIEYIALSPAVFHPSFSQQLPPFDTNEVVAVEASVPQDVGPILTSDEQIVDISTPRGVEEIVEEQIFDALVPQTVEEQFFAVTPTPATTDDDPVHPILDDEQMLRGCQAQIDQCMHLLKTKEEVIERYEKHVAALLERVPRAVSSRDRRVLQKPVDEYNALILHERQLEQTAQEKLASLMREVHEKRERAAETVHRSSKRKEK